MRRASCSPAAHRRGEAALDAGFSRFRPVVMTALAMLIGMLPMALGLGDGGEQNAPLGRAVIGGLAFGTLSTLLFVPVVFGFVHAWLERRRDAAGARGALDMRDAPGAPKPRYAGAALSADGRSFIPRLAPTPDPS
jgi:hypothetical protein